jgi:dihydroorotase-like cyclic amidohydrolase
MRYNNEPRYAKLPLLRIFTAVNEGRSFLTDVLIRNGRIAKIQPAITVSEKVIEINGEGWHLYLAQ